MAETLAPATFGTYLRKTWELYTEHFQFFLTVGIVFFLPLELINSFLVPTSLLDQLMDPAAWAAGTAQSFAVRLGGSALLELLVWLLSTITLTIGVRAILDHKPVTVQATMKRYRTFFAPLLGTSVLSFLLLIPLAILLVIPAVVFGTYWIFMDQAVLLSNKKYMDALRYSKSLVKGRWWEVFGRILVLGIAIAAIQELFSFVMPDVWMARPLMQTVVSTIVDIISLFIPIFLVVYYLDLERAVGAARSFASSDSAKA